MEDAFPRDRVGLPIGVLPDVGYEATTLELNPGDSVIIYSDGILDAGLSVGRRFGETRLREGLIAASQESPLTARQIGERIVKETETHAAGAEQFDDIALVCYGRQ